MSGWPYQEAGQGSEGINFCSVSWSAQESSSDVRPIGRSNFWASFLVTRGLGGGESSCGLCSLAPWGSVYVGVRVGEMEKLGREFCAPLLSQ